MYRSASIEDTRPAAHPPAAQGRWERVYFGLYALYVLVGIGWRLIAPIHGDALVYVQAARRILDGSFDVYSFLVNPASVPPLGGGYSYSPLTAILMAPFVGVADLLGWGQEWAERLSPIPLLFVDALALHHLRLLVRAWRPGADERFLFLGVILTLFLTGFWGVTAYRGHHEGLVLLFLVLTLRLTPVNLRLGGLCAGLALAAKQTAFLELLPVGLVLLAGGAVARSNTPHGRAKYSLRDALVWGGIAAGVLALFLLPAVISNPGAAYYSLVTQEALREVWGPGLPVWLDRTLAATLSSSEYASAHQLVLRYSNFALLGAVTLASAAVVLGASRSGHRIGLVDSRLLALVALGGVLQVALGKWNGGHYYQLPLALVFLWDAVRTSERDTPKSLTANIMDSFPWIGLGAAIAFRSVTQFEPWWLKEALIVLLFVLLAGLLIGAASRGKDREQLEVK